MFLKVYRVDGVIVISKQDVNMTLLVVRMVVLLIGRSTSLGSTVWLNSPVVEENLWFISRVLHSPPPNILTLNPPVCSYRLRVPRRVQCSTSP